MKLAPQSPKTKIRHQDEDHQIHSVLVINFLITLNMLTIVFLLHLGSTWFMVGLIWLIQIVHYPLFARVGVEQFVPYEREHSRLITYIVAR